MCKIFCCGKLSTTISCSYAQFTPCDLSYPQPGELLFITVSNTVVIAFTYPQILCILLFMILKPTKSTTFTKNTTQCCVKNFCTYPPCGKLFNVMIKYRLEFYILRRNYFD